MLVFVTCIIITLLQSTLCLSPGKSFKIDYGSNVFLKDGQPFRYISAGIHYFRVPRIYWKDRLLKAKAMGLNTIQTYVPWNIHEPDPGQYDFKGGKDLVHFLDLAYELNLLVILRPGPYIDAEWEFGGFPWWLANDTSLVMRSTEDIRYMNFVKSWFDVLMFKINRKLYKNGGPIIALQVENEYGNYYACDSSYLKELQNILENNIGSDVVLFTTDGYTDNYLQCGTIPTLYKTIDFGTEISAADAFKQQRKYQRHGPLVNSEYYTGWLDYWGRPHQTRDSKKIASHFDEILALNASVNLYMFEGGTNFGFMNGVDIDDNNEFAISPTSYDYDAPLSEAGDPTLKYFALRGILRKYVDKPLIPVPRATTKTAYGTFLIKSVLNLTSIITKLYPDGAPYVSVNPLTMENIGQGYGFLIYRASIPEKFKKIISTLTIDAVHDRLVILIDGKRITTKPRGFISVRVNGGSSLELLVENQGRITYAPKGTRYLPESKGIQGHVKLDDELIKNWEMFPLNDKIMAATYKWTTTEHNSIGKVLRSRHPNESDQIPSFYYTDFFLQYVTDTYVKLQNWSKGQIYINDFNLGRYWQKLGPQKTLYVPKSMLKVGKNKLLVFELDKAPCTRVSVDRCAVEFVDRPILAG